MIRRRSKILAGLAVASVALSVASAPSQAEDGPSRPSFTAMASADGGRLTFAVPNFAAVEEVLDGGGAVAQSYYDFSSQSSYAALPHPGANALAFPGLMAAVTGQSPPFSYPFYVIASNPTNPKQELKEPSGTYALAADASGQKTAGVASFGSSSPGTSGGTRAATSIVVDGDTVTASAENRNEGLSLGDGALRLFHIESRSVTKQVGSAEPTTETQMSVSAAAANGMTLGFGPDGLVVAQQGVPLPAKTGLDAFNDAIAPVHLAVRFRAPQGFPGGASAAVFEVVSDQPAPNSDIPASVVTLRFGGATSGITVEGSQVPAASAAGASDGSGSGEVPTAAVDSTTSAPAKATVPSTEAVSPDPVASAARGADFSTGTGPALLVDASVPGGGETTDPTDGAGGIGTVPASSRPVAEETIRLAAAPPHASMRSDSVRYAFAGLVAGVAAAIALVVMSRWVRGEVG